MRDGAANGEVLKHPLDRSMGNVYKVMPEWNLRDITEPGSDNLLDILKFRATTSLVDQYCSGLNDGPGDYAFIKEMMDTRGLRHVNSFKNCYTLFYDEHKYGESIQIVREVSQALAGLQTVIQRNLCIPRDVGKLILQRQLYLLQGLNIIIENILELGSQNRDRKKVTKKPERDATAALQSSPFTHNQDRSPSQT